MEIAEKDRTISDLKELIRNRIYTYYPELNSHHIEIKGNLLKKCHQSTIYQFDIYNTRQILKSLILKKRIYNRFYDNNVVEKTEKEFEILKFLNSRAGSKAFTARVLDVLPQEGILITERVEGRSLYEELKKSSYLPLSRQRKLFLKGIFSKTGEWLRNFHEATSSGKSEKIGTQEFIQKAEAIVNKFPQMGISIELGKTLLDRMKKLEEDVLKWTFPVAVKHGDFQPLNIMFHEDKVTILDINARSLDITIKDVSNLVTGMHISKIKLNPLYDTMNLNEMAEEFLRGYYRNEVIPYPAIDFVKTLGFLEQLDNIYARNQNPLKRKIIASFYRKEIAGLIKESSVYV